MVTFQKYCLRVLLLVLAVASGSCSIPPPPGTLIPATTTVNGTSRIPIFVATTRERSTDADEMLSGERAAEAFLCRDHRCRSRLMRPA
jgi:esterase/lipase superfamily enzyme